MSAGGVSSTSEHIAIVGMAGRFPAARNVRRFWQMLADGRTATRWLTEEELMAEGVSAADLADPNYVRAANILPDMECFDAGFFGFSPREASILDPQHRHFLETAWEAFEDSGHVPEKFDGRIGVFAGSGMQAYLPFNLLSNPDLVAQVGLFLLRHTGNDKDFMPTRLSYLLNLRGPSIAVQTACSTSLVAVHLASASLLSGECDMALAGGVTIELPHRQGYRFTEGEILSPDGLCRAFDENSKGTVFGSGAAVLLLRRLDDAIADGDDIRAVLIGSAVNNDGSQKAGYLAPSVDGQAEAAAEALALAGIEAASVSYIEAHGTGTPVGDPIELAALTQAYGDGGKQFCGIGSVKTNIGHLDTAAGAASLIKVAQALRNEAIPPSLNYETPNSRFNIAASPFYVANKLQPWPRGKVPRRAAVNSLGVGGTNAHVIVQEAPLRAATPAQDQWRILPFSARNDASLDDLGGKWQEFLDAPEVGFNLADAAFTLQTGRRNFDRRRALVARDLEGLQRTLKDGDKRRIANGQATKETPGIVFMFPGGGAQFPGVGKDLLAVVPAFRDAVEACFAVMPADVPGDLRQIMFEREASDKAASAQLERPIYALPALFVLEIAYARMWQSWGVQPTAMIGHSAGEYTGAVISGILTLADALLIVSLRGRLMEDLPEGAMAAIPAGEAVVRNIIGDDLDFAAINAPDLCVVSGPVDKIAALEAKLVGTETEAKRLRINVAAHSRMLEPALAEFRARLEKVSYGKGTIAFASSTRGDWAQGGDHASADYWTRHLRNTVRFGAAMRQVLAKPSQILLEIGPGNSLGSLAQMSDAANKPVAVVSSTRQAKEVDDDLAFALTSAAKIWTMGGDLDWTALPSAGGQRVSLPTYAFEKQVHWVHPGKPVVAAEAGNKPDMLSRRSNIADWFETWVWRETPLPLAEAKRGANWLIFDDESALSAAIQARLRGVGAEVKLVRPAEIFAELPHGYGLNAASPADFETLVGRFNATSILYLWPSESDGFNAPFLLMRALQLADIAAETRVTFVTNEIMNNPDGALLLGPVRVAPREITGLTAQLIEVESSMSAQQCAAMILSEGDAKSREDHVILRSGKRFVAALSPIQTAKSPVSRLKSGATYVISGGAGGIGRELARFLAHDFKANVALLGRSASVQDSRMTALISEAKAAGGSISLLSADVTDKESLSSALDSISKDHGAINGVFHAAGTINDAPMAAKTLDDALAVLAPKVAGGRNLSELLPVGTLDFFAVFSSSSVVIAPPGQVDYVAANAWLEALAASRPDGISIAWGVWSDIGMAAKAYGLGTQEPGPHPLLGPLTRQTDGSITFEMAYDPTKLWVLHDHVVGGVKVLPGTAYFEIVQAAAAAVEPKATFETQALSLALPMAFPKDLPRVVKLRLQPEPDGYDLRIESSAERDAIFLEHCRSRLVRRKRADVTLPNDLKFVVANDVSVNSGHALQSGLIDFGPRWQNIGTIRTGAKAVQAEFALPQQFESDLHDYPFHPGLTDMAVTIGLHLLPELHGIPRAVYAPVSVDRVRLLGRLQPNLTGRAILRMHERERMAKFDVALFGKSDQPLVILEGLSMRYVSKEQLANVQQDEPSLTSRMLMQGIRASEAPAVFALALTGMQRQMIVSSLPPSALRLQFTQAAARPARAPRSRSGDDTTASDYANKVERAIAVYWDELLGVSDVKPDDDFFDIGGHSLSAVRLFAKIRKEFDVDLPLAALFQAPTLRSLANLVISEGGIDIGENAEKTALPSVRTWSPLVQIKKGADDVPPLFCVHGAGGNVLNFRSLAGYLNRNQSFYGLQAQGADGALEPLDTIEEMATIYLAAIRAVQPEGPYFLAGYSGGGVVAYDMAQRLKADGQKVGPVIMFDSLAPHVTQTKMTRLEKLWAVRHWSLAFAMDWPKRRRKNREDRQKSVEIKRLVASGQRVPAEHMGRRMTDAYRVAQSRYKPTEYDGDITLFTAGQAGTEFLRAGKKLGWETVATGAINVHRFDCDHFNMMSDPTIGIIAEQLNDILRVRR